MQLLTHHYELSHAIEAFKGRMKIGRGFPKCVLNSVKSQIKDIISLSNLRKRSQTEQLK